MSSQNAGDGTVGKALHVLEMVAAAERPLRFSALLSESSHPKATLYRLLQTLVNQGMLAYDANRQTYSLGIRLVRLAHTAWRQSSIAPIARPYIDALAASVGETVHLAQMDGGQVLYVDKRNAKVPVEMFAQTGKVGPGYCTGVGKALMAFMDERRQSEVIQKQSFYKFTPNTLASAEALRSELDAIRAEGVAFDREEHEPGIICIAAPILVEESRVIAAVSITTTTQRNRLEDLENLRPDLVGTADQIAAAAKDWQFPA